MHLSLNKSTIFKRVGHYGYLSNISTRQNLTLDENGALWLSHISYIPKRIDYIVNELVENYDDADFNTLQNDFHCFMEELISAGFIDCIDVTPPRLLYLELTQMCNERCVHCYIPSSLKGETAISLSLDKVLKIIDEYSAMSGTEIVFTGGEIGLYKNLFDVIEYAKQKGLIVTLITNGTTFTNEDIKRIKELDIDKIQISLYSLSKHIHDSITKNTSSFEKTTRTIKLMIEHDIPVEIACVVIKDNRNDVFELLKHFQQLGVEVKLEVNIVAQSNCDKSNIACRLSIVEYRDFLQHLACISPEQAKRIINRHHIEYDEKFNYSEYLHKPLCTAAFSSIYIAANGNVLPCGNLVNIIFGNINAASLCDIWTDSQTINSFRQIREKDLPHCAKCELSNYCLRCLARNYTENGNMLEISQSFCEQAKIAQETINVLKN